MSCTPDGLEPWGVDRVSVATGHAVVGGGSMAGLLAARVLANYFEQVTLVEHDVLTDNVQTRKGVPQGRMPHVLLPRGLGIVEASVGSVGPHAGSSASAVLTRRPPGSPQPPRRPPPG